MAKIEEISSHRKHQQRMASISVNGIERKRSEEISEKQQSNLGVSHQYQRDNGEKYRKSWQKMTA